LPGKERVGWYVGQEPFGKAEDAVPERLDFGTSHSTASIGHDMARLLDQIDWRHSKHLRSGTLYRATIVVRLYLIVKLVDQLVTDGALLGNFDARLVGFRDKAFVNIPHQDRKVSLKQ